MMSEERVEYLTQGDEEAPKTRVDHYLLTWYPDYVRIFNARTADRFVMSREGALELARQIIEHFNPESGEGRGA